MNEKLRRFVDLTWRLFVRNIRAAHRKSFLGLFWLIIPSVINAAVWVLLKSNGVIQFEGRDEMPYVVFTITGILFWHNFRDAMEIPFKMLEKYQEIIKNLSFDHLSIMGASVLEVLFNSGIRTVLLFLVFAFYGIWTGPQMLLFIFPAIALLLLGFALSMWIMPFYLMYRDVPRLFGFATQFGFLFTPIVYEIPKDGSLRWLTMINPVTAPLVTLRDLLLGGNPNLAWQTVIVFTVSLVLFLVGVRIYRITCLRVVERI
jgi:lipopolysaccharide transport system permease protein